MIHRNAHKHASCVHIDLLYTSGIFNYHRMWFKRAITKISCKDQTLIPDVNSENTGHQDMTTKAKTHKASISHAFLQQTFTQRICKRFVTEMHT